jgi:hypothetical protein
MSKYVPFLHSKASHPLLLYPIGTIFALIEAGIMSYTRMCLDSCGSLCVRIGRAESPQ